MHVCVCVWVGGVLVWVGGWVGACGLVCLHSQLPS